MLNVCFRCTGTSACLMPQTVCSKCVLLCGDGDAWGLGVGLLAIALGPAFGVHEWYGSFVI